MVSERMSINKILFTLAVLCISCQVFSQVSKEDTADYIQLYFDNALEYNLMIAASKGLDTEVKRMILQGADIKAETEEGATPLIIAVANVKPRAVDTLLAYGADPNKITSNYETSLLIILKKMVSYETIENNILTASKETECLQIAESLLRYGADIDFQDRFGATVLNYASIYGSFRFVDLLLYYMADIDKKSGDGTTPLMAAIWAGNANIADLLIQNGANLEARDNEGFTPFLIAAQNGDSLLLDLLMKNGIDIYEKDKYNWDALSLSIKYDHREAVEMLIKAGNKWNEPGRDALNYYNIAVRYGRNNIFDLLEKNNFPEKYKIRISQVELSISSKFNIQDVYTGLNIVFREPRIKMGFLAGFDTKLWYTKVLVKQSDGLYYQYMDKSSIAYAGIFKDLPLTDNPLKSNFLFSASLSAAYSFGNKFKGTEIVPESKFKIMPAVSIKWVKKNFMLFAGFEYMNSGFEKIWPVWCRAGLSYNFDFDYGKTPVKTIKWY
jgi:ankyrin repeat protein